MAQFIGRSRGCPPTGHNSLIFAYISAEKRPNRKYWIRHCNSLKLLYFIYRQLNVHLRTRGGLQFLLNFPAGSLLNLGLSHDFEVNGNSVTHLQTSHAGLAHIIHINGYQTGSFTSWSSEVVIYWDTVQHLYHLGLKQHKQYEFVMTNMIDENIIPISPEKRWCSCETLQLFLFLN